MKKLRILLADDHIVMRTGLRALLERQPNLEVVGECENGRETVALAASLKPDVVVMDVRMPNLDGIAATTEIRSRDSGARIILLSTYEGDEQVYQGLRAGAKGYLLKDTPREELLETIRSIHLGGTHISPVIAAKLADRVTRPELSVREIEVLRCMVLGKSNKEIGTALYICEGTVKVHVSKLLKKLKASGRTEAINLALMHGIVNVGSSPQSR